MTTSILAGVINVPTGRATALARTVDGTASRAVSIKCIAYSALRP